MTVSIRKGLAAAIKAHPDCPKKWDVKAYSGEIGNIQAPVVIVRQTGVQRNPGAPRLYRDTDFDIALIEPGLDPERTEDALDNDIETLLDILEALDFDGLVLKESARVMFDGAYHGYDTKVTVTNEKE